MMRRMALLIAVSAVAAHPARGEDVPGKAEIVDVRRIWDEAPHNAFTDLIRYRDRWFCVFREGESHVAPGGAIRVLTSDDGKAWASAARVAEAGADLRDPHLSVTPDGRLMLAGAAAFPPTEATRHRSRVWFSRDGKDWGEPTPTGEPDVWIWRPAWHDGAAYGVGYDTRGQRFVRLYKSGDGSDFRPWVSPFFERGKPNESALLFLPDGTALCLLRRDGDENSAQLGRSRPPYKDWDWRDLGVRIGGPSLARLPDGRLVAGVRLLDGKPRTALCRLDPDAGTLKEFLTLPSGGDTSYPGLAWHDGRLWVSYYSSHEGRARIYLAEVRVPAADAAGRP